MPPVNGEAEVTECLASPGIGAPVITLGANTITFSGSNASVPGLTFL